MLIYATMPRGIQRKLQQIGPHKKTGRMPWTANEVDGCEENEILLTLEQATDPPLLVKEPVEK